jgi:RNA exonuclease 4
LFDAAMVSTIFLDRYACRLCLGEITAISDFDLKTMSVHRPSVPHRATSQTRNRVHDDFDRSPWAEPFNRRKENNIIIIFMKPFFTKKQKKLMRERKLKRKRALQGGGLPEAKDSTPSTSNSTKGQRDNDPPDSQARPKAASAAGPSPGSKRRRSESMDDESPAQVPTEERKAMAPGGDTAAAAVIVVVPSNLAGKDAKKFRKDARRKHRDEGKEVKFVDEKDAGKAPPTEERNQNKRRKVRPDDPNSKPPVPRINDIVQEAKQEEERQKKLQSASEEEGRLPEAYKQRYVALDCEMVGIGTDGKTSVLARVSIVDWNGEVMLDTYVQVESKVVDFRTKFSGIKPKHIKDAMKPDVVRQKVADLVKDKILVGHALHNDLHALLLTHPKAMIRDTAKYRPLQRYHGKWRPRKLRDLVKEHLGKTIQDGSHDSVTDAASTMELFRLVRGEWERELEEKATRKTSKDKARNGLTKR